MRLRWRFHKSLNKTSRFQLRPSNYLEYVATNAYGVGSNHFVDRKTYLRTLRNWTLIHSFLVRLLGWVFSKNRFIIYTNKLYWIMQIFMFPWGFSRWSEISCISYICIKPTIHRKWMLLHSQRHNSGAGIKMFHAGHSNFCWLETFSFTLTSGISY